MAGNRRDRVVSLVSILITATTVAGFTESRVSYAVNPDIPRIEAGASNGSISNEIELGAAYLAGRGVERNAKQAAYWYEKAANSGDPAAQEEIGYFYQAGIGVERDPARAVQWFQRAVAGGLVSAKVNLGVAYVWGLGVRKDPGFAVQLFRDAVNKGSGMGACYLGDLYYFGIGVTKSDSDAMHWFEIGSKLHSVPAKLNLALILLGKSDQTSQDRAIQLLREASTAGSVAAKHQLGLQILRRPDLGRSQSEAVKELGEAAQDGYWKSSAVLGVIFRDGRAVPRDNKKAYYYFRVAVLQGHEKVVAMLANDLTKLSSELGSQEVREMDAEATAWVQKHNHSLGYVNLPNDHANSFPAVALEQPQKEDMHAWMLLEAGDAEVTP